MPRHFGILVPSTNTTGEIEYCRLPAALQVHTGRLGKGGNTPFSPSMDAEVAYQAKLLGEARVEVIALAQTSASLHRRLRRGDGEADNRGVGRAVLDLRPGDRPGAEGPQGVTGRHGDALFGRGDRTG